MKKYVFKLTIIYITFSIAASDQNSKIEALLEWTNLAFEDGLASAPLQSQLIGDVRLYKDNFYFSLPRYRGRVPVTLAKVDFK